MILSLPRPRKQSGIRWLGVVMMAVAAGSLGCSDGTAPTNEEPPDDGPAVVLPGETLPMGTTVKVDVSGTFGLPTGAVALTTRCFGTVVLTYAPPANWVESNTCESADGSSSQTNDVNLVTNVMYDVGPGAFAHVTVR